MCVFFQCARSRCRSLTVIMSRLNLGLARTSSPTIQISRPPLPFSQICIVGVCPLGGRNPFCVRRTASWPRAKAEQVLPLLALFPCTLFQCRRGGEAETHKASVGLSPWGFLPNAGPPCKIKAWTRLYVNYL